MGLTKQYLRYVPAGSFNIIASPNCNVVFVTLKGQEGRFVAVAACEDIVVWDLRLGEKAVVLSGEKCEVTALAASPNKTHLAAGYADGTVKVFDLVSGENVAAFSGHKSAITCLSYDSEGHRLASGSKDTDIIVWDVIAEVGLHRLNGHKGPVTQLRFMSSHNILVSSSKDTFVKFWDLNTQHCFRTIIGHRSEVWDLTFIKGDKYLVTGCGDSELRVWHITFRDTPGLDISHNVDKELITSNDLTSGDEPEIDTSYPLQCEKAGAILRGGRGRVVTLTADTTGHILGCHGTENVVELFYFRNDMETNKRWKKRQKNERKKTEKASEEVVPVSTDTDPSLQDEVRRLPMIKTDGKVKAVDLIQGKGGELRISTVLSNNTVELYTLQTEDKVAESRCLRRLLLQGHRSEVRTVCFSSDNLAVVSGSAEAVKMWNRPSLTCLRTVGTGYTLTACFVPGDRHLLVGLKDGRILIIDIAAGDILEEIPAHSKEVWSICLTPDQRGCASGGGDCTVKFWDFELIPDPSSAVKTKVLSILHTRTLKLEESVLCVRISPNNSLIAVSLLDSTVKIFFVDTLKFFLSLYGHKLPVLCMDISTDSTLIATGSADRNVKLWGLHFGDCHKSIFAHDDSVTGLQFIAKTHQFFTCGKDGKVKQWDADTYDKIITLQGHRGEAWSLAVSPNGQFVASCGADRVLRLWERSSEPLVLQDQEEEEREEEENATLATGEESVIPGQPGHKLPSKKTVGSEKAAEQLLEALQVCRTYRDQLTEHKIRCSTLGETLPTPAPPPIMLVYQVNTPDDFLLEMLRRIRSSDLEEALLLLPFASVCELIELLPSLLEQTWETELVCRCMIFLLKIHHGPIVNNHVLLPAITKLQSLAFKRVNELRDTVGFNLHGLQFLQREFEEREGIQLFRDATQEKRQKDKKKRRKERAVKRAMMTL